MLNTMNKKKLKSGFFLFIHKNNILEFLGKIISVSHGKAETVQNSSAFLLEMKVLMIYCGSNHNLQWIM